MRLIPMAGLYALSLPSPEGEIFALPSGAALRDHSADGDDYAAGVSPHTVPFITFDCKYADAWYGSNMLQRALDSNLRKLSVEVERLEFTRTEAEKVLGPMQRFTGVIDERIGQLTRCWEVRVAVTNGFHVSFPRSRRRTRRPSASSIS